jgi:hypothetical protein
MIAVIGHKQYIINMQYVSLSKAAEHFGVSAVTGRSNDREAGQGWETRILRAAKRAETIRHPSSGWRATSAEGLLGLQSLFQWTKG